MEFTTGCLRIYLSLILCNLKDFVRIFIYAPEDYKIKRVMEVYGDTLEEARKNIRRSDEARASYYKNISQRNWGNRHNYELMIDSSIGVEASVDTICHYIQNENNQTFLRDFFKIYAIIIA